MSVGACVGLVAARVHGLTTLLIVSSRGVECRGFIFFYLLWFLGVYCILRFISLRVKFARPPLLPSWLTRFNIRSTSYLAKLGTPPPLPPPPPPPPPRIPHWAPENGLLGVFVFSAPHLPALFSRRFVFYVARSACRCARRALRVQRGETGCGGGANAGCWKVDDESRR